MARYKESVCRLCRRENTKLFLKGERCTGDKCAIERKNYCPGQHGQKNSKFSEYRLQLREKQKIKRIYGVLEKQFRIYFKRAEKGKSITGEALLQLLERRLDTVVHRLGLAVSMNQARQLVRHNHFTVNGKRVNIPSYVVKKGDVIEVREADRKKDVFKKALELFEKKGRAEALWLTLNKEKMQGIVNDIPKRDEITLPVNEQLVVELYSK